MADAEQSHDTDGMIALYPADPAPLVVDGGETADDLHVTLHYLGDDITSWGDDRIADLLDRVSAAADAVGGPIEAKVMGHATFAPGTDHEVAVHLIGDSDRLAPLHAAVNTATADVLGDDEHPQHAPWVAHLTGRYGADASVLSYAGPVTFDRVEVVICGEHHVFPLATPGEQAESLAREAYAHGWALSGGPMTDRVRAGCVAAIGMVREHGATAEVLEATMQLGSLEGTWAAVFGRREALYAKADTDVAAAWSTWLAGADVAAAVTAFRRTYTTTTEAAPTGDTDADARRRRRADAVAAALALLRGRVDPTDPHYQALVLAVESALRSADAEGYAGALAIAADEIGYTGFDFDAAYTDALDVIGDPGTRYAEAMRVIGQITDAAANDLGGALAAAADADASDEDMVAIVEEFLAQHQALSLLLDLAMGVAFNRGVLALYSAESVAYVDFVTAGDERVCPTCGSYEMENPWERDLAPLPAIHPRCRCVLVPTDPLTSVRSVDLTRYTDPLDGGDE